MSDNKQWKRLFGLWKPARDDAQGFDFADYGTAFGLDMSLAHASHDGSSATGASTAYSAVPDAKPLGPQN